MTIAIKIALVAIGSVLIFMGGIFSGETTDGDGGPGMAMALLGFSLIALGAFILYD